MKLVEIAERRRDDARLDIDVGRKEYSNNFKRHNLCKIKREDICLTDGYHIHSAYEEGSPSGAIIT